MAWHDLDENYKYNPRAKEYQANWRKVRLICRDSIQNVELQIGLSYKIHTIYWHITII